VAVNCSNRREQSREKTGFHWKAKYECLMKQKKWTQKGKHENKYSKKINIAGKCRKE